MARGACLATSTPVSTWLSTVQLLTLLPLLLLPILSHLATTSQVPPYEFEVKSYDKPVPWQKCPEGWRKLGKKCYKVFYNFLSWDDANKVCRSVGGGLVEVEGFNQNQEVGRVVEGEVVSRHQSQQSNTTTTTTTTGPASAATAEPHSIWIGLKRDSSGDYSWASGHPAFKQQGFWDVGHPPALGSSNNVHEQCCDIILGATALGRFRWRLGECDKKRVFVCETKACNEHHFRCADGRQCVSEKSVCDGVLDCEDGSDERSCKDGNACGGKLSGEHGTFHSPGYPRKYPTKVTCVWQLDTSVGSRVQLKFESFDVERKYDSVEVYDGSKREVGTLLGRYNGTSVPTVPLATSHVLLVILTTDDSLEAAGFNASWSAVVFDGPSGKCGGNLVAHHSVQWFTSPLFPSPYPHSLVCDWVISSSSGTDVVTLQFQEFDIEGEMDWVEVYNGATDSDTLLGHFSGSGLPRVVVSTSASLFVRFRSDSKLSRKGFNATYLSGCDVDIASGYATVGSPGFGVTDYPINVVCSWRISDPLHRKLTLIFHPSFDTEAGVDVVQVYNSSQISPAHLAGEFSGSSSPSPIHSTAGAFVLRSSSDGSVQRLGWSASVSYDCEPLQHEDSLQISTSTVTFGTVVHYGCGAGYRLNGASSTRCDMRGLWNPDILPTCQLMECGSPAIPKDGYLVSLSGMTFGHAATYRCSKGYHLQGTNSSSCQMEGWSVLPTCTEIYCPKEPPPPHGSAMAEDNTFGAQREFFCNSGYQLVGAKFSYCTAEGAWTSPVPQCRLLQCPGVAGIIHGQSDPAGPVQVGQQVHITCEWGHQLSGHSHLTCLPSLDYDHPIPFCTDINECELDGVCVNDGHQRCQNLEGSYRCVCDSGYQHAGPDQQTVCQDINECASENGGCNQLCRNLPGSYECYCRPGYSLYTGNIIVINGGQLVPNKSCIAPCKPLVVGEATMAYTGFPLHDGSYLHPTEAIIVCPRGNVPNGPARLQCLEKGGWSAVVTSCQAAVCPLLDMPMNGQVMFSGQVLGSNATYTCEEGFKLRGPKLRFCQLHRDLETQKQSLLWTGPQPSCRAVSCGRPPEPANGVVSYIKTTFKSVATYSCLCGFQLEGDSIRRCQSNGLWSGNSTHCIAQRCRHPGKPKYGSIVGSQAAYPVGSAVRFQCDRPGYQLSDPWAMECLSGPTFQVSPVLPTYRVSVGVSFVTGDYSVVTAACGVYYQGKAVRLLRNFAPQLQTLCVKFGQPRIAVDNDTTLSIRGRITQLTGWYEVWTEEKSGLLSACRCGQAISDTLSDFIASSSLLMLDGSQELGCPPAFLQRQSVNTSDHRWMCPHGLGLMNAELQCGQGLPACTQACVTEPPRTVTPPLVITTPSPHSPTPSTTISLPTPAPPTSTPSTTTVVTLASSSSAGVASTSSETPSGKTQTTQSTIKDIMTGSTTASSPSESSDQTEVAMPLFVMEVEDKMEGSFTNITCIDEVHVNINSKVNKLMRDFNADIGKGACLNGSDIVVELLSGNIRFKGTQATIFIQFSLRFRTAQAESVEQCAQEFKDMVFRLLPMKLEQVIQQVTPEFCQQATYTYGNTNVSRSSWDCPKGYQLDSTIFVCQRTITTPFSSLVSATPTPSATIPPIPVQSIPRMTLTFQATLTPVVRKGRKELEACLTEYDTGLMRLLTDLEPFVQNYNSNCSNVFVDITTNLSITVHDANRLRVMADVRLLPLADSVRRSSLTRCATFMTSMFSSLGRFLPNVTVPAGYLLNCSSIQLAPPSLTSVADPVFYCDDGFFYEEYNFLCLDESLPSFTVEIHLTTVLEATPQQDCRRALESSATSLSQAVMEDVHAKLMSGSLCNASAMGERVIPLLHNSQLSVINMEAIISIPFVLLSLGGGSEAVNECTTHLYSYLSTSLGNPVSAMMGRVNTSCTVTSWPRTFSQAAEKWGCFEGRVYNAQTHSCDHFGALEESITKTKGLMSERKRRDTRSMNGSTRPFWNATLPVCQDHEPPVFNGCPKTSIKVPLGPAGPVPVTIDVPSVSDNSGGALVVSYKPSDFRPHIPYIFRQNVIVNITAVDTAGNKAVCRISVFLIDITPPSVHCHKKLHRHHFNTNGNRVQVIYPDGLITASDYGDVTSITFDPAPGTSVEVMKKISVKATVKDRSGNAASCSFFYLATNDRCPLWELPAPGQGQGQRTCTSEIQGSVGFGVSCQVACPKGYKFVTAPPTQYICVNGSVWHPHHHVPRCGALSFTNFDFNMTLNFTYDGASSNNYCLSVVSSSVLTKIEPLFKGICRSSASFIDIKIEHMGFFDPQSQGRHLFVLKMKVSIILKAGAKKGWASQCGMLILAQMDNLTLKISTTNCSNVSFLPPSDSQGQTSCSPGFVLVEDFCLECPVGTYHNSSTKHCEECPQGQYQSTEGQSACDLCPEGTSTVGTGATTLSDCLDLCPAGSYSTTGLSPCEKCERGQYQREAGRKDCVSCPDGTSTSSVGAASSQYCLGLCPVGHFSPTGLLPCFACPLHHYSSDRGATMCVECATYQVTNTTASTTSDSCVVVDWCGEDSCAAGSTCVNQHRFAQCLCAPGFTGERCDVNVDECASQPCVNGGTCEDGVNSFTCLCKPGYEGKSCEVETDECSPDPCLHGQCLDAHLTYTCQCLQGYTGLRCEVNIDDCRGDPCQNGGQCIDLVDSFHCDCSGTGYEGATCQNDINNCHNTSCLNAGTCHNRVNGFNCTCMPGFTGTLCETDIDDCHSYPCANNALCIDQINSFNCICQPGYTGDRCESDINECASSPCVNGGTCTDLVSDYLCTCQRGYEGKNCQVDVNECASSPCDLAGTERCEDGINTFTCHCLPLWEGERCDTRANPCASSPCKEGATCTVAGDTFVCLCPPDFTGTLCDHHMDDCQSGPCMNNGTCQDGVHSFSCQCIAGLTGKECEVNVDECSSQPCAHGATCLDLIDGFTCRCASGYEGELCEKNIDDCASQPCAHGGTCGDLVDQFQCYCPPGYKGKTCSDDVNECDNSPCQNGATCVNLQGHFQCRCPMGYSGDLCQHDLCAAKNSCLNNATCVIQSGHVGCRCSPQFAGVDCGKEKSGDYDLLFHGKTASACRPPDILVPRNAHLALCLWLRYASPQASGTVLTVTRSDMNRDDLHMDDDFLLKLSGGIISVSLEGEREPRHFSVAVTDSKWHHMCYQWLGSRHAVYMDGVKTAEEKYGAEVSLSDRLKLVLGHPRQHTTPATYFQGEISQANLFSMVLDDSQIENMALNCSSLQLQGDMFAWPQADAYLEGQITVVTPAVCGRSQCAPGFHGTYCNQQTDKIAPRVVSCPSDQSVTKNSAMVTVTWEEPVFEDNVAIARIQQTYRSGQAFHQGEYQVTYVAYDAENNSAECSFAVVIKPFDCVEPLAPKHGAKVCQTWLHGSFCSLRCFHSYFFEELPPTFYTCGRLGFWDPPLRDPRHFPACSLMTDPGASLVGVVDMQGPGCTKEFQTKLKTRFTDIMTELDAVLGLCLQKVCDFENGFSVICDDEGGAGRRKREASSLYRVAIHLDLPGNSSAVQKTNGQWAAEEIITAIKRGHFDDSQFKADPASSNLSMDFVCEPGQVLRVQEAGNITRACLDCPEGYYYNTTATDCRLCEEGSYSSEPRQLRCQPCPPGTTTAARGSTSSEACFELCFSGSYYDSRSRRCQPCPRGQYQAKAGQRSCLYCPVGQSTRQPGATASDQCANVCALGQEINEDGQCQPCPRGSYQDSRDVPVCQPCPYGWTTATVGATALHDCSVVVCPRGHRWLPDNRCEPCPVGTYQPTRGSNLCTPCGAGLTTTGPGAVSQSLCHAGPVDECRLATHKCDDHATCVDTEQDYYCVCQAGFTGDGINCTDLCEDFCENDGVCDYGVDGKPFCNCKNGFTGDRCQEDDLVSAGLSSAVAGGIAGSVVAVVVIIIVAVACYWRHRIQQKKSHDRIYRSRKAMTPAAFYNDGYESVRDSISTPSQLIVREQSSSTSSSSTLSMAPRWNRSTFANSDEDEMDACWFESFPMDDLSLGSDAFTRTARLESESYF